MVMVSFKELWSRLLLLLLLLLITIYKKRNEEEKTKNEIKQPDFLSDHIATVRGKKKMYHLIERIEKKEQS